MNDTDELPQGYFWDSEQAKKEYYRVEAGLTEAKEKLLQAQARLQTVQVVHDRFWDTPGIPAVEYRSKSGKYRGVFYSPLEETVLFHLNEALNPYWLPEGGKFEANSMNNYRITHAPWHGCLVAVQVQSEPIKAAAGYGREKRRSGKYVFLSIPYAYTKWVGWFTPTGDVGMSAIERTLREKPYPFTSPNPLYDKLMGEVKQEVSALLAPLSRKVVLKFIPDLGPSNIDEIRLSSGIYKEDVPSLSWHALTRHAVLQEGQGYHLTSYEGICWINCGRWELHRFPTQTLQYVRSRIAGILIRLQERIDDAAWAVVAVEEEIAALRRRQVKIRMLHYKPLIYKQFWQALGTSPSQKRLAVPVNTSRPQIPEHAQSLPAQEN